MYDANQPVVACKKGVRFMKELFRMDMVLNQRDREEYRIFCYVYNFPKSHVTKSERPDFVVKKKSKYEFGVEVTQLFYSESFARLEKIPNYFDEILNGEPYRHKTDVQNISRKTLTIYKPNTHISWVTHAIEMPQLDVNQYAKNLKNAIVKKNDLFVEYLNLPYINLIVSDESMLLSSMKLHLFYSTFIKDDLKSIIQGSPYSEIFLVTKIEQQLFCYPLKLLTFYAFSQHLLEIFKNEEIPIKSLSLERFSHLVLKCFRYGGFKEMFFKKHESQYELIWGRSGLRISEKGFNIIDYSYENIGDVEKPYSGESLTRDMKSIIDNRVEQYTIHTNLGRKIIG